MNPIDRNKIWKMVGILALITVVAGGLLRVSQHSSYTLGIMRRTILPWLIRRQSRHLPRNLHRPSTIPMQMRQKTCRKDLPWQKLLF